MRYFSGVDARFLHKENARTTDHVRGVVVLDPSTAAQPINAESLNQAWRGPVHLTGAEERVEVLAQVGHAPVRVLASICSSGTHWLSTYSRKVISPRDLSCRAPARIAQLDHIWRDTVLLERRRQAD